MTLQQEIKMTTLLNRVGRAFNIPPGSVATEMVRARKLILKVPHSVRYCHENFAIAWRITLTLFPDGEFEFYGLKHFDATLLAE